MSYEIDPNKGSGWKKALKVLATIVGIAVLAVILLIGLAFGACFLGK
ncbi:MAG: hypothetical protein JWO95_1974 [Verrucomicrobiales bacterium]|nr:hypothetical protein [Verrucomicrobiales bacterium]